MNTKILRSLWVKRLVVSKCSAFFYFGRVQEGVAPNRCK